MNKPRLVAQPHPTIRQGEGSLIDVRVASEVLPNGLTARSFKMNILDAPVPDRSYAADVYGVRRTGNVVKLLFGQTKVSDESALRSLLVIRMGVTFVDRFIESLTQTEESRGVPLSIERILGKMGAVAEAPYSFADEPAQTVCLAANFVASAISDGDACLDFLQASPFALDAMGRSQKLAVQAVVRVDLACPLVLGMLRELQKVQNPPLSAA